MSDVSTADTGARAIVRWKGSRARFAMSPLRGKPRRNGVAVYDVESKDGDSQREGFSRAFLVGVLDTAGKYVAFRNATDEVTASEHAALAPEERAIARGGCVDRFLRYLLFDPRARGLRRDRCDLYGHNGGRFDASFVLPWCARHADLVGCEVVSIQGRAQRVLVYPREGKRHPSREVTFIDSFMILPMSLAVAAETFAPDLEGKEATFDRDLHESDPAWYRYNRRDCVALRNAIEGLRQTVEDLGGELGMTAASTAMRLFRRAFQGEDIPRNAHLPLPNAHLARGARGARRGVRGIRGEDDRDDADPEERRRLRRSRSRARARRDLSHDESEHACGGVCTLEICPRGEDCDGTCHGCLHEFILRGYVGGRSEVFERFAGVDSGLRYYDRNSSYPASLSCPMPVGEAFHVVGDEEYRRTERRHRRRGDVGFVECDVFIPKECQIPILPRVVDDKLKFPYGRLRGVWDVAELDLLSHPLVGGRIVEVHRAVWFRSRIVFKDFVDRLYAIRRKHRDMQEEMLRLHVHEVFDEIRRERREEFRKRRASLHGHREWGWSEAEERIFAEEWARFDVWKDRGNVVHANVKRKDLLARLHRLRDPDGVTSVTSDARDASYAKNAGKGDALTFANLRRYRALSELCKLMLNALYGKFGMNPEREELLFVSPSDLLAEVSGLSSDSSADPKDEDRLARSPRPSFLSSSARPLDGRDHARCPVWRVRRFVDPAYIIPQIAAHVTALSRVALAEVMLDVLSRGGKVYYCDTDSCLCDIPLSPDLVDHARLGAWKEEEPDEILSGEFVLPKMYEICRHDPSDPSRVLSRVVHVKGIGRRAQTPENFRRLVAGEAIEVVGLTVQHRTILREGLPGPREIKGFMKRSRASYDKRVQDASGRTRPCELVEW